MPLREEKEKANQRMSEIRRRKLFDLIMNDLDSKKDEKTFRYRVVFHLVNVMNCGRFCDQTCFFLSRSATQDFLLKLRKRYARDTREFYQT